jgi:hypothetical protein
LAEKIKLKKEKNANKFRQAALHFQEHGYYTAAPEGTTEWRNYWIEEARRSLYGFTAEDGDHITGYFYFYLNYCQIIRVIITEEINSKTGKLKTVSKRKRGFPQFYDYDRVYFDLVETAENNGKHLAVLKKRRSGYSYKNSAMLCRNFYLIPNSRSYAIASEAEFLIRDGVLTKAWDYMDFLDEHTAWAKKRQKTDTKMHKRASYIVDIGGVKTELGFKSEIIGLTLKNDINKVRGKSAHLFVWEEAGDFPYLKDAWMIASHSAKQDEEVYGLHIAFGTGGTAEGNFEGLKDLFYEPEAYGCLPVENIWDEGLQGTTCGFFVPQYVNMWGPKEDPFRYMDVNGNTDVGKTLKYIMSERETFLDNVSDKSAIDKYVAEMPLTPQEASLNFSGNIFPKKDLIRHLATIRNSESFKNFKQVGELWSDGKGGMKWELNPGLRDLTSYRVKEGQNKDGAVVIWEHPIQDSPYGLYIAGIDPYDHDKSLTNSLGSCIIYKRFQDFESYYDLPVAEYTGRPETAEEYYENVRNLLQYYKATALYENEKKGLFTYFSHKHCEYLLADQPDVIKDIIKDSKVERGKGIHMVKSLKDWGEGLIKEWLNEEHAPGQKNLTKIFSEPLLEELISYSDEGNFDRVMALMMVMIYREQLHHVHVKKRDSEGDKSKTLFPEGIFRDVIKYA